LTIIFGWDRNKETVPADWQGGGYQVAVFLVRGHPDIGLKKPFSLSLE
jgi:hypothetical protein